MRYITDDNGYVREVSFGADIACENKGCTEYTGLVPSGYSSLMDWFTREGGNLHHWQIVSGNLTRANSTTSRYEERNVEYITSEFWDGKEVYTKIVDFGALPANAQKSLNISTSVVHLVDMQGVVSFGNGYEYPLPVSTNAGGLEAICFLYNGSVSAIVVKTSTDMSGATALIRIKYTKS